VIINEEKTEINREYMWMQNLPTLDAYDWNCKYIIKANREMVSNVDSNLNGFIMI